MKKQIIFLMNLLFTCVLFGMESNNIEVGKSLILRPKDYSLAARCFYAKEDITRLHPDFSPSHPFINRELLWADRMQKQNGLPRDITTSILLIAFNLQEKNYIEDFMTYCRKYAKLDP